MNEYADDHPDKKNIQVMLKQCKWIRCLGNPINQRRKTNAFHKNQNR